jgi:hypothetical protein
MNRLFNIGFQVVGQWILADGAMHLQLKSMQEDSNVVYAFVVDGAVKYIGKTTQPLFKRMYGYIKPGPTQSTNIKNRANIQAVLDHGQVVLILALRDNGLHHYGAFHINLAAGLEDDLIAQLKPEWNGRMINGLKPTMYMPDIKLMESSAVKGQVSPGCADLVLPDSLSENVFVLKLHKAYFNSGFFNVSVKHQYLFGDDRSEIRISCSSPSSDFCGYINRSANINHTPRIMGGVPLKRWFHEVSELNGLVQVEVVSPTSIRMIRVNK